MKLPNVEYAYVDIERLRTYILNPNHPEGRHKPLVFQSALGITVDDAELLRNTLLEKAKSEEATLGRVDQYGQRYRLDFVMITEKGKAEIRSAWIVRLDETFPRFLTCYVID
jgi:hypothetical protein